jgi:hypothetical protein
LLKKIIVGFVLLVAGMTVIRMYSSATAEAEKQGRQAQIAQNTRPDDLLRLKRPAVREACTKHSDWDMEMCQTMDQKEVMIGMTDEQLSLSWGKPKTVNTTTTASRQHEQWVYGRDYVYLDNGVVRSMQSSRKTLSEPKN